MFIHNTLVPYLHAAGESKTKPTQHSVKELLSLGIQPDAVVLRTEVPLSESSKNKISLFCNVQRNGVFEAQDLEEVYELPFFLHEQKLDDYVLNHLRLPSNPIDLEAWSRWVKSIKDADGIVKIALVGKYVELHDAYLSVASALKHAAYYCGKKVKIGWIKSPDITEKNVDSILKEYDGILVPGGFGERGSEGKKLAIKYAREKKVPFLGICFGMQLAAIEYAENVLKMKNANTTEFDPQTPFPVISLLSDQYTGINMGGTLRLGLYDCELKRDSLAHKLYGQDMVQERHRHRYEFNNKYRETFEQGGMTFSGINPEKNLVEILELKDHPFFIASQFHPEFLSRPLKPSPLFLGLIEAAIKKQK